VIEIELYGLDPESIADTIVASHDPKYGYPPTRTLPGLALVCILERPRNRESRR